MLSQFCFIPVDVILGEMYLETEQFDKAASHYTTYLTKVAYNNHATKYRESFSDYNKQQTLFIPSDMDMTGSHVTWFNNIFKNNAVYDQVSYIPMAVNSLRGTTSMLPEYFGNNYYGTDKRELQMDEIQIMPSKEYWAISDSCDYYYYRNVTGGLKQQYVGGIKWCDMRSCTSITLGTNADSTKQWIKKYNAANVMLYRTSTIYLHLAEALNRLGHPDAAFAILKDGITEDLLDSTRTYITDDTRKMLQTTYPFLSDENRSLFPAASSSISEYATNYGIHGHGCGVTGDGNYPGRSPYQLDTIVGLKMKKIADIYNVAVGATKADSINAIEDILCDEYALELAFEGTRWYDLMRLARHKNKAGLYGADFGGKWLARKLMYKNPTKDLTDPNNWYLPFK